MFSNHLSKLFYILVVINLLNIKCMYAAPLVTFNIINQTGYPIILRVPCANIAIPIPARQRSEPIIFDCGIGGFTYSTQVLIPRTTIPLSDCTNDVGIGSIFQTATFDIEVLFDERTKRCLY